MDGLIDRWDDPADLVTSCTYTHTALLPPPLSIDTQMEGLRTQLHAAEARAAEASATATAVTAAVAQAQAQAGIKGEESGDDGDSRVAELQARIGACDVCSGLVGTGPPLLIRSPEPHLSTHRSSPRKIGGNCTLTPIPVPPTHTDTLERAVAGADTQHREALRTSEVRSNNEKKQLESRLRRAEEAAGREREEGARLRWVNVCLCGCGCRAWKVSGMVV